MKSRTIIDITVPMRVGMPVWPGDPQFEITSGMNNPANVSRLAMSTHAGTHVDAPKHSNSRWPGTENLLLSDLCGPVQVVMPQKMSLETREIIAIPMIPSSSKRVIIKTGYIHPEENEEAPLDYMGLSLSLARGLVNLGVRMIGIDSPSVESQNRIEVGTYEVHDFLLSKDVAVVESLDLKDVSEGAFDLFCLPLKVIGAEGAPARAILLD